MICADQGRTTTLNTTNHLEPDDLSWSWDITSDVVSLIPLRLLGPASAVGLIPRKCVSIPPKHPTVRPATI